MEPIEMIEKVSQSANVTFEEARTALEANNWDVEATLAYFEQQGKKIERAQEEAQVEEELEVIEIKDYTETEEKKETKETSFSELLHKIFAYLRDNNVRVEKEGTEIVKVNLMIFVILLLLCGEIVIPVMLVGLFLKFRYSIVGKSSFTTVNKVMDSVSRAAQAAVNEFKKA